MCLSLLTVLFLFLGASLHCLHQNTSIRILFIVLKMYTRFFLYYRIISDIFLFNSFIDRSKTKVAKRRKREEVKEEEEDDYEESREVTSTSVEKKSKKRQRKSSKVFFNNIAF